MKSKTWSAVVALTLFATQVATIPLFAQDNASLKKTPRFKLVDLGTLGGPVSLVFGQSGNLNQQKELVTSCADTAALDPNYPNINPFFGSDPYIQHTFRWQHGVLSDLGVLPGGTSSCGQAINNRRVVAGASTNGAFDPVTGIPEINAVRWQQGEILDLGTLGGTQSVAWFLNNSGQIAGEALNAIPDPFADVIGLGVTQSHAFLWQNGHMQDLGTLGGPDSEASYVNERGEAAGVSFTNYTPNDTTGFPTLDPFLWRNGKMVDLGTLGGTVGGANALNNRGQVVGYSYMAGDQTFHPFLWDRGVMKDLGTFGGSNGQAIWMNDAGEVVGVADFPGDQLHDAFLWKNGAMTDLGNLGLTSRATGINSRTQVVGNARRPDGYPHAFLWEKGTIYDLNTLIPSGSGVELLQAPAINDSGVIDAVGLPPGCDDPNACGHAFLLIPCGEDDPGSCQSELAGTAASVGYNDPPVTNPAMRSQSNESPAGRVNQLRDRLRWPYHIPGQAVGPEN